MEAILLHQPAARTGEISREMRHENISLRVRSTSRNLNWEEKYWDSANLILLYIQSPERHLVDLLPTLRKRKYRATIVVIDEKENTESKKYAIDQGADGYFAKPLSYSWLAIKLKNLMYRKDSQANERWIRAFNLSLNVQSHSVRREQRLIALRNKEFSLLEFFMMNRGKLLTRTAILEHVWDRNAHFSSNTVDVHINRLRQKIDEPFREKLIHTVPCIGYIFEKRKKGRL